MVGRGAACSLDVPEDVEAWEEEEWVVREKWDSAMVADGTLSLLLAMGCQSSRVSVSNCLCFPFALELEQSSDRGGGGIRSGLDDVDERMLLERLLAASERLCE